MQWEPSGISDSKAVLAYITLILQYVHVFKMNYRCSKIGNIIESMIKYEKQVLKMYIYF